MRTAPVSSVATHDISILLHRYRSTKRPLFFIAPVRCSSFQASIAVMHCRCAHFSRRLSKRSSLAMMYLLCKSMLNMHRFQATSTFAQSSTLCDKRARAQIVGRILFNLAYSVARSSTQLMCASVRTCGTFAIDNNSAVLLQP